MIIKFKHYILIIILLVLIYLLYLCYNINDNKKITRNKTDDILKKNSSKIYGTEKVPIYIIDNFLDIQECNKLINDLDEKSLHRSTLTHYDQNDTEFRTSKTGYFKDTVFHNYIEKKIKNFIKLNNAEISQIQFYSPGEQFKPHFDAFDPIIDKKDYNTGQRSWTFMIYLNDVEEGGETYFTNLNLKIKPKTGKAVIWYNLNTDGLPDTNTTHAGLPVIKGKKYIITKWFKV